MDRAGGDRRKTLAALELRRGMPSDAREAATVLNLSLSRLAGTQGRPIDAPAPGHVVPALEHMAATYPDGFWVARDGDRTAGFVASALRSGIWFLGGLFVLPDYQGAGLGRRLVEQAASASRTADPVLAVISSGGNPISNALYASCGMYPWLAVLYMEAEQPLRPPVLPPSDLESVPLTPGLLQDLAAIDRAVTGIDRTTDHAWMLDRGRPGWVFCRGGRAVAYGFLGGDGMLGPGQVGPVAALEVADVRPALGFMLARLEGAPRVRVMTPAPNTEAQRLLWGCGFTFSGVVGLLGVSRPFGCFDRYLPAGNALL